MNETSLRRQIEDAHGTYPGASEVRANFERLFGLARDGGAAVPDLADAFAFVLDQWAHVDAIVDPAIADRLREWTLANWTTTPHETLDALCTLLVNVGSPEVTAFLQAQADATTDADVLRTLRETLDDL
jgi:hypothetical protein